MDGELFAGVSAVIIAWMAGYGSRSLVAMLRKRRWESRRFGRQMNGAR